MLQPRGSLGAVCINNVLIAVSGSGISSNLDSVEALVLDPESASLVHCTKRKRASSDSPWFSLPTVNTARHALSATMVGEAHGKGGTIFAVGGWKYGDRVRACNIHRTLFHFFTGVVFRPALQMADL